MKRYVTPQQMKTIEAYSDSHGVSYLQLMKSAGCELAQILSTCSDNLSGGIMILCGSGNNGGDGFVAAKLLSELGIKTAVVLVTGEPSTEISAEVFCELSDTNVEVLYLNDNIDKIFELLKSASLIVDAIFGTGFHGELPPQVKACLSYVSRMPAKKIAVDVPSGGNCVTGEIADSTLKCDITVTFGYEKIGFLFTPLKDYCGNIVTANIGFTDKCFSDVKRPIIEIDKDFVKTMLPERSDYSYKGDYGRLLNVSGSKKMPGAAAMSTMAALRSGVGLCTLASVESVTSSLSSRIFETMYLTSESDADTFTPDDCNSVIKEAKKSTAVLIGCGLGYNENTEKFVSQLIRNIDNNIILDADGLNCIAKSIDIIKNTKASLTLTPHIGELARLCNCTTDEIKTNRLYYAEKLAEEYGVTVVSKGLPTIIAGTNGFTYVCRVLNSGLAKGGSGDVLAGIIASLTAQGMHSVEAAAAGTYIHGLSAEMVTEKISKQGMLPTDVINELPFVFKNLIGG